MRVEDDDLCNDLDFYNRDGYIETADELGCRRAIRSIQFTFR